MRSLRPLLSTNPITMKWQHSARTGRGPRVGLMSVATERSSNRTLRGVVDLGAERLVSWDHVPGVQARIPPEEFVLSDAIAKADPRVVEALAKRGITDLSKVLIETWAPGNFWSRGRGRQAVGLLPLLGNQ